MIRYYNPDTNEQFKDTKIVKGSPSGVVNQVKEPYKWVKPLYKIMQSYTWYVSECNLSQDKTNYNLLPKEHKYAYDTALAQLIVNDSIQTKQLSSGISTYITSPSINGLIARQAYEEFEHAVTYTTIAEEVCENIDKIYELHKHEECLRRKNEAVTKMFSSINENGGEPSVQDLLIMFAANQVLEQLVFSGGFIILWSFNFSGTNKAIQFIERDESGTHVPLFKNIFRTTVSQNKIEKETIDRIIDMVKFINNEEIIWLNHISKQLLGFTEKSIKLFVEYHSNSVCENLSIKPIYEKTDGGPLMKLFKKHSLLHNKTKTNFFETTASDYAINILDTQY